MDIISMIMAAVSAVRPDVADKAKGMMGNYSMDESGLRKLVGEQGGAKFLDEAERFANQAPRVQKMMKQFGVDTHDLRNTVEKVLSSNSASSKTEAKKPTASEFRNRLDRLK